MGVMQMAVETYRQMEARAGIYEEGMKEPLAPAGHTIKKADYEVEVTLSGEFVSAQAVPAENAATIVPATEASMSASGRTVAPYPLSGKLCNMHPGNESWHKAYLALLGGWAGSEHATPSIKAVYAYMQGRTLLDDLYKAGAIKGEGEPGEGGEEKSISFSGKLTSKEADGIVRWKVRGAEEEACWKDPGCFRSWYAYYAGHLLENREKGWDYITGEYGPLAGKHPKCLVPSFGNAKLISDNDKQNFTYLGRFLDSSEALSVGYRQSQEAHNAIRWLAANYGRFIDGRTTVSWVPGSTKMPVVTEKIPCTGVPDGCSSIDEYREAISAYAARAAGEYPEGSRVCCFTVDAEDRNAGRLAILQYSEMPVEEYFRQIAIWDAGCCWENGRAGVSSPSLWSIARYAAGTIDGDGLFRNEKREKALMPLLIQSRLEGTPFPAGIKDMLTQKAGNLMMARGWKRKDKRELMHAACAAIRKHRLDTKKEEWDLELDTDNMDRSYLYGRLLAVLEKAERDTYRDEKREPNAIRYQAVFANRPMHGARIVLEKVKRGYYRKLTPGTRAYYESLISQIMDAIRETASEGKDEPLEDVYILGYYSQKKALYTKKENTTVGREEEKEGEGIILKAS